MRKIKKILFRIRLILIYLCNMVWYLLIPKTQPEVQIVSSLKFKNKVKEDLLLQQYFLRNKIRCKIIAWEKDSLGEYSVIRTVWGYHKDFKHFLSYIQDKNTVNPSYMILDNIDKKKQYALLENYNIPRVETKFIQDISDFKYKYNRIVIKPVVSAGGDNTHLVENVEDLEKCRDLSDIMIQPYIDGVRKGELSIVVMNKEVRYGVIRYPGVFTNYLREKYVPVSEIDSSVMEIVNRIMAIPEYMEAVYMRIDLIKDEEEYKVLEVELTDPNLYIETIPDQVYKKKIYQLMVDSILEIFHLKN